jgi:hypothetical protein
MPLPQSSELAVSTLGPCLGLTRRFHAASAAGASLSAEEQHELEQLVDCEWQAAIARGAAILKQVPHPPDEP